MEIKEHDFSGIKVEQRLSDGFVNLTQLAQAATKSEEKNKLVSKYFELRSTKDFLKELFKDLDETQDSTKSTDAQIREALVEKNVGANLNGFTGSQDTWAHVEVAIDYCQWVSPKFRVRANRMLRQAMTGELTPVTLPAQENTIAMTGQFKELCSELSAKEYELQGFKQTAVHFAELLGKERANRLEWMSATLSALHSGVSDEQVEAVILSIRREVAVLRNQKMLEQDTDRQS